MARDQFATSVRETLALMSPARVEHALLANAAHHKVSPAEAAVWYDIIQACADGGIKPVAVEAIEARLDEER